MYWNWNPYRKGFNWIDPRHPIPPIGGVPQHQLPEPFHPIGHVPLPPIGQVPQHQVSYPLPPIGQVPQHQLPKPLPPIGQVPQHQLIDSPIEAKYKELIRRGFVGTPITPELPTSDGVGRYRNYRNGMEEWTIYWHPETGAHEIHGRILHHWRRRGAETSYLGFPTFDQKGQFSRFERGTIQLTGTNEFVFDVSDAREYKSGVIHVSGAAANGWAELIVSSTGGYKFRGSMRSTGALSYDVLMVVTIDLRPFGGPVLAFTEKGDVEGTLVLGGHRAHTWDTFGMDSRIKDNWQFMRRAGIKSTFTVEFGPGDLLAVVGSIIGAPLVVIVMILAGSYAAENYTLCGCIGHEYYDHTVGEFRQEKGVIVVPKGEPCPPPTPC